LILTRRKAKLYFLANVLSVAKRVSLIVRKQRKNGRPKDEQQEIQVVERSIKMITQEQLITFYKSHSLYPDQNRNFKLSDEDYLNIILGAKDYGKSFGMFVMVSIAPVNDSEFILSFETWDDLFHYYCSFMTGLVGNKS
jgi:hypothetical protein